MNVSPIASFGFKANTAVYDFVDNETPAETKTKKHLDSELKKKVPNDKKGRTFIEWLSARGLEVCYSRPYVTHIVKGYPNDNGKIVKSDDNILVNKGSGSYLLSDTSQFTMNRPINNAIDGTIRVDLTFREANISETKMPTTRGHVGDYNEIDTIEISDIKKASKRMWKPYIICYSILSAIGIGCIAGLAWLIPLHLNKTKIMQKTETIELIEKAQPQKFAKDTLEIMKKRI
jgi:hypothetical protein